MAEEEKEEIKVWRGYNKIMINWSNGFGMRKKNEK